MAPSWSLSHVFLWFAFGVSLFGFLSNIANTNPYIKIKHPPAPLHVSPFDSLFFFMYHGFYWISPMSLKVSNFENSPPNTFHLLIHCHFGFCLFAPFRIPFGNFSIETLWGISLSLWWDSSMDFTMWPQWFETIVF